MATSYLLGAAIGAALAALGAGLWMHNDNLIGSSIAGIILTAVAIASRERS